jgi:drug/metabolite transporter (DMT)-like permease
VSDKRSLALTGAAAPIAELMVAASLWGFGFIATAWALKAVHAFELNFLRFTIAAAVSFLILAPRLKKINLRPLMRLSLWPAIFLFGTLIFQTWGMHYTTATKAGFITTLYVVFVPVLESFHLKRKLPVSMWVCVGLALVGTIMIVNVGLDSINTGDVMMLVCAFFATFQIYYLGIVSPKVKEPFAFNSVQSLWCWVFSIPLLFHAGVPTHILEASRWDYKSIAGVLSLALGSTVLSFFLQVRAQAKLSPTVASLLCLLESPFAMIFAMYWLDERLGNWESAGAALIFVSAVAASYIESTKKR